MDKTWHSAITDIPGIKVGHAQNLEAITGCTVLLCEGGAIGGVDQRGGAPGTRETDLLRPMRHVEEVHAVVLAGGSAYGLDAAGGVVAYLEEHDIGYQTRAGFRVPIVPAAILFDLSIGDGRVRPDAAMGRAAAEAASDGPVEQGCVGAGIGACVGGFNGPDFQMKGGIGTASIQLSDGVIVGALVAVNAVGDIYDPELGRLIAGTRRPPEGKELADTMSLLAERAGGMPPPADETNTVIGVVATNAQLTKVQINKVAQMAHNGLGQTIRPAHTQFDGDTLFALSTGEVPGEMNAVGAYAAEMVAQAILNGMRAAVSMGGRPSARDLGTLE